MLKPGAIIDNATLCRLFGVANSGGLRRSLAHFHVVVVADWTRTGVRNRWDGDALHYTGQGAGDQKMDKQNRTLARSTVTGERLHLFEVHQGGRYLYRGQAELAGEPYQERQLDARNIERTVWMFPLRLIAETAAQRRGPEQPPKAFLPAGAYAVIQGGVPTAKLPEVHNLLDRLRALGIGVVDQRDVDGERYAEAMSHWHAEIEADMRRRARLIVGDVRRGALASGANLTLTADETEIDDHADEARLRDVLDLIGRADDFERLRQAAYESVSQPEAPAFYEIDGDRIDDVAELRAQISRRSRR